MARRGQCRVIDMLGTGQRYCQIGTLYHLLEMSALRSHTRAKTSMPFLNDALSQLVHILDFPAVHPLLKKAPYLVMDRVEVLTI